MAREDHHSEPPGAFTMATATIDGQHTATDVNELIESHL
jgi:hypothetical protein